MSVRARTYRGKFMYGNVLAPKIICQPLVIRPIKLNQLSFSISEINKPLPAPVYSVLLDQIQVQKPILVVATMSDHIKK